MVNTPPAGGSKRKRRKYKARDSYIKAPTTPNMSNLSFAKGSGGGGIGAYLQQVMQDASNKINPANNDLLGLLTGSSAKPMDNNLSGLVGGNGGRVAPPQRVAPQVTMEPKTSLGQPPMDAQSSSLDMLTELAMSMLTQPGASYDYESAMQSAAQGIRQAYAAEIGAIRSNNRAARKDTKRARKQIEHLYEGLAKQLGNQAVKAENRGDRNAAEQQGIYQNSANALGQLNQQITGEEAQMLQDLGLQAAAPEVISPNYDQLASQASFLTGEGARAAELAGRMGDAQSRYMSRSQAGALREGADQSAGLIAELQNYLRQNRGQIGILKGNRAKEVQASNANIQGQAAQMAADQDAQTWKQVMDLIDTVSGIENTNFQNELAANKFQWDQKTDKWKMRQDALDQQDAVDPMANYAPNIKDALSIISQTQDPHDQKALNALMQMFGSNEFRTDQVALGNGDTTKLTVYEAMAMARKKGMAMGLQGKELNDFIMAAAASVG